MTIHPTAIIEPGARLADDVHVGPWCSVGSRVTLGAGCVLQSRCVLDGDLEIGERNFFGHGCVIGGPPQDFAFDPQTRSRVRIGSGNTFREYVTIHRGTKEDSSTVVGDSCYLMVGTHLGHNVCMANRVIVANNSLFAGYVEVGEGSVIGGGAVFHQFIRIGAFTMVRGGSRFSKDIPPFCVADSNNVVRGINTVGLRRAGFKPEARTELRRAFKRIFRSGLNVRAALESVRSESWQPQVESLFEFIRTTKRGICTAIPTYEREGVE
jgi:UDP-N-acetylglucosamine acyltransferase